MFHQEQEELSHRLVFPQMQTLQTLTTSLEEKREEERTQTRFFQAHHDGKLRAASIVSRSQFGNIEMMKDTKENDVAEMIKVGQLMSEVSKGQCHQLASSFDHFLKSTTEQVTADMEKKNRQEVASHCKQLHGDLMEVISEVLDPATANLVKTKLAEKRSLSDLGGEDQQAHPQKRQKTTSVWTCRPPTAKKVHAAIMEGENAMLELLPYPPINEHEEHAFVHLEDVVADAFGNGTKFDFICEVSNPENSVPSSVKKLSESKRASKICECVKRSKNGEGSLVLWIVKWSDDAEMNSLLQNRGSIWIQSVTTSIPSNEMNTVDNTHVIAIGPKEGNHDFVENNSTGASPS